MDPNLQFKYNGLPSVAPTARDSGSLPAVCWFSKLYSMKGDRVINEIFRNNQIDEILQFANFYSQNGSDLVIKGGWQGNKHLYACARAISDALKGSDVFDFSAEQKVLYLEACERVIQTDGWKPLFPPDVLTVGILLVEAVKSVFKQQSQLKYPEVQSGYAGIRGEQWLVTGKEFNSIDDLQDSRKGSHNGFLSLSTDYNVALKFATSIGKKNKKGTSYFIRYYITNSEKEHIVSIPVEYCTLTHGESEILLFPNYTVSYIKQNGGPFRVGSGTKGFKGTAPYTWSSHPALGGLGTSMMFDISLKFQKEDVFIARCDNMIKVAQRQIKKWKLKKLKFIQDTSSRGYAVSDTGEYVSQTNKGADPEIVPQKVTASSSSSATTLTMDDVLSSINTKIKNIPNQAEMAPWEDLIIV